MPAGKERNGKDHKSDQLRGRWWATLIEKPKHYFEKCRKNREKESPEQKAGRRTANATWVIALFAIVTAIVGVFQWLAISGQLSEMRRDDRPWIGINAITPLQDGSGVLVVVQNAGKEPAFQANIEITGNVIGVRGAPTNDAPCSNNCTFRNMLLLPGVPLGARVPRTYERQLGPGESLRIIVRADYLDSDGNSHKTGACIDRTSQGEEVTCHEAKTNFAD